LETKTPDAIKKDMVWNAVGSLVYAAAIAVLAFLVMRIQGEEDGGIFAFGFSTFGQQMFIIAYFGLRPFQITDVKPEYYFSEYHRNRIETCLLAVFAAAAYLGVLCVAGTYTLRKCEIVLLLALYKICDGYADVLESECQRSGMLWRGGRELTLRTIFASGVFLAALLFTRDLCIASLCGVLAQLAAIAVFGLKLYSLWKEEAPAAYFGVFRSGRDLALLKDGAWLFLSVFLDFYVFSGAKYAIDLKLGDASSGVFNILFMPTSVIYLAANFIIKPFMTRMAGQLETGDEAGFKKTKRRIALIIAGLTALALICVVFLGSPVLRLFELLLGEAYEGKLRAHTGEFFLIILGGGLYATANLYYYILVMKRRQKAIFIVYAIGAVITFAASSFIVEALGMTGGAILYASMMSLLLFGMKLCDLITS